jgi:membrane protein DedA with SNARE-associated domain
LDFIADYLESLGLGGLLVGLIIEALGFPFPGGALIMLSGFLINQNRLDFYSVFLVAVTGFNLGAIAAFFIGRRTGNLLFEQHGRYLRIHRRGVEHARAWLENSAPVCIILGRFVPMVSNVLPYLAGASRLNWHRFLFYNFIFTIIWVSFNISVGMIFGYNWPVIAGYFRNRLPLAVLGLLLVYFAVKFVIRQLYALRSEKI